MADEKTDSGVDPNIWIRQPEGRTGKGGITGTGLDFESKKLPKYKTLDVLTLRITNEDFEFLHNLEREIMKNRSKENRKERITKNTIMRAMLGCFKNVKFNSENIPDENELRIRIMKGLKDHTPWTF